METGRVRGFGCAEAVAAADEDSAGAEMLAHLELPAPFYEKAWRDQRRRPRA